MTIDNQVEGRLAEGEATVRLAGRLIDVVDPALVLHDCDAQRSKPSGGDGDVRGPALGGNGTGRAAPPAQPFASSGAHVEHGRGADRLVVDDSFKRPRRRLEDETIAEQGQVPAVKRDLERVLQ